jgi:CheY-like chemotaxis protein
VPVKGSQAAESATGHTFGHPPKVVLVVEDEADILESLSDLIGTIGHVRVLTARDGREALRVITGQRIDLLVTDHRMPRMNGLELLRMLHVIAPNVPSIMITAYPDLTIEDFARRVPGFQGILSKPCDPGLLIQNVERALGR